MYKLFLCGIILLAFLLRVPFLDLYPIGFTPDEASFGYDAYSILHTGKDQWGRTLPLVLESFGDFKAPLYTYLDIPFVAILGLTKTAVRLPNAILGVGAVWTLYMLIKEFIRHPEFISGSASNSDAGKRRMLKLIQHDDLVALISALLLAISPWHIQLSRGAFEANLVTFFLPLGILFFLKGLNNSRYFIYASIAFGLSLFSYHSAKVVVPLVVGMLVVLFWRQILNQVQYEEVPIQDDVQGKRRVLISSVVFSSFVFLTAITFFQGAGRRASDVSIFRGALEAQADQRLVAINNGTNPTIARLTHNKYFVTADRFIGNYTSYFSSDFLFREGPREGTYGMLPGVGVLYWFELPLLIAFGWLSFRSLRYVILNLIQYLPLAYIRKRQIPDRVRDDGFAKILLFILIWLLVSPIPTALTQGVGHAANRAATMLPVLQIAGAFGFYQLWMWIEKGKRRMLNQVQHDGGVPRIFAATVILLIVLYGLGGFLKNYFLFSPTKLAKPMLYGDLEVAYWLKDNTGDYSNIIVSNKLSEPHIFISFANEWNPNDYQKATEDWNRYKDENLTFLDQLYSYGLGKYVFKRIEKEDFVASSASFLVGKPDEFPDSMEVVKKFMYPNDEVAIIVVKPYQNIYAYQTN